MDALWRSHSAATGSPCSTICSRSGAMPAITSPISSGGTFSEASGRPADARRPLAEARETFERLRATPWLERAAALEARLGAGVPAWG